MLSGLRWKVADAEALPFDDESFDLVTIAFGLRNVTDIPKAVSEARRVLRPGGRFACLEFSSVPYPILREVYDAYSFQVIPRVGAAVAGDAEAYQYLVESIRKFPAQEELEKLMKAAGFAIVNHENYTCGVVAVHNGFKF
jgi:ubiquinone/menaquinone biosynthesis methyltransferase